MVKIWKPTVVLSLPGWPSPVVGSDFWKVSDQLLMVPVVKVEELFWTTSVQVPWTFMPVGGAKTVARDCWGS